MIRLYLADILEERGFRVIEAADADEAIQIMEAHSEVEIVVTDIQMPGSMDGLKLSHFIRDRWPPTTLIVISGKSAIDKASLPVDASFIPKPLDVRQLFARLGSPA